MSTTVRANISKKNDYYISKNRYYELKHFCLQYSEWESLYHKLEGGCVRSVNNDGMPHGTDISSSTERIALKLEQYSRNMKMIEDAAKETDPLLCDYIFMAVTKDMSFPCLETVYDIPCSRNTYYDRYRKFFWTLSQYRD